ncbi:hypothetical protein AAVH_28036 [Aphelenchoides avenae]|nr:hypothetical protein AAVH_28036 [Aphelenchus avenae]
MDFDAIFCVWIEALQQLEADVRVQTLEVLDPYYKMDMEAAYRQLHGAFNVQEYVISYVNIEMGYEGQGEELCVDVVKRAKRIGILEYHLNFGHDDDEAEDDEDEDNVDMNDKPEINCFKKNILDFAFSAPECEELYVTVEGDGSGLINRLVRHFQEHQSTSQRVSTFTWKWGINYEGTTWERNDSLKPIAERHPCPFKDVTLECRRRQCFPEPNDTVPLIGQLSGDVHEFRNEHDGTHLTVVTADAHETVQFRKGRFELAEAAAQCPPDKKLRIGNNHTE